MDTLAWAHSCNGNHTEGLKLSEHALLSGARTPAIMLHAGLIRYRAGQTESGRGLLERALACPLAFGPSDRGLARIARPLLTSVQQN